MQVFIKHDDVVKSIEFDETLTYADFHVVEGLKPVFQTYDMTALFSSVESEATPFEPDFFRYMARWVIEAPRKRFFRKMKLEGAQVMSNEFFFEDCDNGEEMLDWLENAGKLAARVLEAFNVDPPKPITNTNPFEGVGMEDIIGE